MHCFVAEISDSNEHNETSVEVMESAAGSNSASAASKWPEDFPLL